MAFIRLMLFTFLALGAAISTAQAQKPIEGLLDVYRAALQNNHAYLADRAAIRANQTSIDEATAKFLPELGLEANAGLHHYNDKTASEPANANQHYDSHSVQFRFKQTVLDLADWAKLGKSRAEFRKGDYDLTVKTQKLIIKSVGRYLDVLDAQDGLEQRDFEAALLSETLKETSRSAQFGTVPIVEVQKTKASLELSKARQIEAQKKLTHALENLRELTGKEYGRVRHLFQNGFKGFMQPGDLDDIVWYALQNNAKLASQKETMTAYKMELKAARAGHLPTLALKAVHGYTSQPGGTTPTENDTSYAMISLELPIFKGGLIRAKVKAALFKYQEAKHRYEHQKRLVEKQVRTAYQSLQSSSALVGALISAERFSLEALRGARKGFEIGTVTSVGLMQSISARRLARQELVQARHRYLLDWLDFYMNLGVLDEGHLVMIERLLLGESPPGGNKPG